MKITDWKIKIKRYGINGRKFWFRTEDGGFSWVKISTKDALRLIDENNGLILDKDTK